MSNITWTIIGILWIPLSAWWWYRLNKMINGPHKPIAFIVSNCLGGWSILYSDERGENGGLCNYGLLSEAIATAKADGYDVILSMTATAALKEEEK